MDTAALFAAAAQAAATYRAGVAEAPPALTYAATAERFRQPLPEVGAPAPDVLAQLIDQATPGLRAMTGPRFFG
jgi:hypothetical protein